MSENKSEQKLKKIWKQPKYVQNKSKKSSKYGPTNVQKKADICLQNIWKKSAKKLAGNVMVWR